MDTELLITTFPRLYHMADHNAWPSVQKHGLLSTSALLDLFEISGAARERLEAAHRPDSVTIEHPVHGRAVIRDQKPMSDKGLMRCLTGATPREWYVILNAKVFFWPHEERLQTLLEAQAYREHRQCVITVDTRKLVESRSERILLSPMNSGATKPMAHPRSPKTFLPIPDYPFEQWRRKRGRALNAIAEVAVTHSVPNVSQMVLEVAIWHRRKIVEKLFSI
jgi:hypothetical protein